MSVSRREEHWEKFSDTSCHGTKIGRKEGGGRSPEGHECLDSGFNEKRSRKAPFFIFQVHIRLCDLVRRLLSHSAADLEETTGNKGHENRRGAKNHGNN